MLPVIYLPGKWWTHVSNFLQTVKMSIFHDEIEIEDMEFDEESETYYYPCPCGDRFQISKVRTVSAVCM